MFLTMYRYSELIQTFVMLGHYESNFGLDDGSCCNTYGARLLSLNNQACSHTPHFDVVTCSEAIN